MASTKEQKKKIIEDLKEKIEKQKAIAFADFSGLKVKDLQKIRKEAKRKDCELKIAKKTLISLALKAAQGGEAGKEKLEGEIALCFGYKDEISPFKILYNFSKENENLKILGGFIGKEFLNKEKAIELAKLLGREELIAQLFFAAKAPFLGVFNTFQRNLSILKVKT